MQPRGDPDDPRCSKGSPLDESFLPSDERRAQELDQYYRPELPLSPTDTVLPAYMQLVAWRLGVQRTLISLVDRDTQFVVYEASKTTNLRDLFESQDGAMWAGNMEKSRSERLCAETINALKRPNGVPAYFEVYDLSKDDPHHDSVRGEPNFRYYCGVPIRTKQNIAIGTVLALDDRVRDPISPGLVDGKAHSGIGHGHNH